MCLICQIVATLWAMPKGVTKPVQLRVSVSDEDAKLIESMSGGTLSMASTAAAVLHGALQAIRQNAGLVTFPPRFQVLAHSEAALNERPGYGSQKR